MCVWLRLPQHGCKPDRDTRDSLLKASDRLQSCFAKHFSISWLNAGARNQRLLRLKVKNKLQNIARKAGKKTREIVRLCVFAMSK